MSGQSLVGLILLVLVITTVWFHSTPGTLPDGSTPVVTETNFSWMHQGAEVDAVIEAKDANGAPVGTWYLDGGQLYQPPGNTNRVTLTLNRNLDFIGPGWDLGTWAGYFKASESDGAGRFQPGLRISPVRLVFGTVALDAVASREVAGLGASLYPPTRLGRWWRHWGVGAWYTAPFDGGDPGVCVGLSFSTRD